MIVRSARAASRQLQAPVQRQLTSGLRTIGLSLMVVALYLFLENAGAVSGVFGGVSRALAWLRDPGRSIAYAQ